MTSKSTAGTTNAPKTTDAVGEGNTGTGLVGKVEVRGREATVNVTDVKVKAGWNARQHFDATEIAKLAASIAEIGQLASLVVCAQKGGGFWLVAGEKRLRAMRLGGIPKARVLVIDESMALKAGWAENADRSEISHADRCKWFAERIKAGDTIKSLSEVTGYSESTISNDAGIAKGLHPTIWAAWSQMPGHSRIALQLYGKPPEEQLKRWEAYLAAIAEGKSARKADGRDDSEGEGGEPTNKRPTRKGLEDLFTEVGAMQAYAEGRDAYAATGHVLAGIRWALEFMAGQRNDPTDGMAAYPKDVAALREVMHREPNRQAKLFGDKEPTSAVAAKAATPAAPAKG